MSDALGLCFSRLECVLKSDDFGNSNYWYTLGLIKAGKTLHTWILDVLKEMENEERAEMAIRVSIKKNLPTKSVNLIIRNYLKVEHQTYYLLKIIKSFLQLIKFIKVSHINFLKINLRIL